MNLRRATLATALLSASGLMFEIVLTRLTSLFYFSPFVYVLLSVALLGIGIGAAVATLVPRSRNANTLPQVAAAVSLAMLCVTVLTLVLATVPGRWLALALLSAPYMFLGHALATLFACAAQVDRRAATERLYLADLVGAGLGALLSVALLDAMGAVGAALATAALPAAAAFLLLSPSQVPARRTRPSFRVLAPAALVLALGMSLLQAVTGVPGAPLRSMATPKPLQRALRSDATPVLHRWDAFGRSDLIRRSDGSLYVYLDGGAGSLVPDLATPSAWLHDVGSFPFAALEPESVFIIGPGGGLDVAIARAYETRSITAVELNAGAVDLANQASARGWLAGPPIYGGDVDLVIDEGRSVLRRREGSYDLVLLSQVATDAAEVRSFALAENTVYTVASFRDALARLAPGGALALKLYDELTLTRAMTTALAALGEQGVPAPTAARHLFAVLDARQSRPVPLLMVFDHALATGESVALARLAEASGLGLLFAPGLFARPPLDGLLSGEIGIDDLVAASPEADIAPVYDGKPFFFEFEPGLPRALQPLLWVLAGLTLILVPLVAWRQRRRPGAARAAPVSFALLGAGFMLVEVDVLRRVHAYLGHPILGLAVGLGALLIGAGLGAGLSGRGDRTPAASWRRSALAALSVAVVASIWGVLAPSVLTLSLQAPNLTRSIVAALLVLPLALPLGIPFPSALRAVGRHGAGEVALAWAVNGVASVVGGSAATALALAWGYGSVHLAGVACYLAAAVTAAALGSADRADRSVLGPPGDSVASADGEFDGALQDGAFGGQT